jgi:hypothetical protein
LQFQGFEDFCRFRERNQSGRRSAMPPQPIDGAMEVDYVPIRPPADRDRQEIGKKMRNVETPRRPTRTQPTPALPENHSS